MVEVVYEDNNFVAVNKPAGMLVHGRGNSKSQVADREETLVSWLLRHYPKIKNVGDDPHERPGIVHRLDKDTSGILIVALNQKTFNYLKKLFQEHRIKKTYIALVYGKLKGKGVIDAPIGLKSGTIKHSVRAKSMKMVKDAITEYRVIKHIEKNGKSFTLVSLIPKTGRTHQLRVHMNYIHHPVVGDTLYGPKNNTLGLKRQFLHAASIEFPLPGGSRIRLEADLPEELKKITDKAEA
ncbi:MAG: RluA family pseudouridine synthase [Patescibacteria group bacterium]|nr:RluA family pseudouridine synthase [Patescibacteria group bacterium]